MFLTKTHLDRRTFLRGMGATVALPLLDAMIPARTLLAAPRPVTRAAFVYFPHGAIMHEWTPAGTGADFRFGRILEPLAPFRRQVAIVTGIENRHAYGPVHTITPGTWLSGTSPRRNGDAVHGATIDQMAADHLGRDALLPSMSVAMERPHAVGAGAWDAEYDESYSTTLSFRPAQVPVPMAFRPRAVFDTLFGQRAGQDAPDARRALAASLLDRIAVDAASLRRRLGPSDRALLGDYLDTLRDLERRVDAAAPCDEAAGAGQQTPAEVADRFAARMALMFDLVALAFRADITRVVSVMMAAEASTMTYDHLGVAEPFHLLSHHQNDPDNFEKLVRIQAFHTRMFARFVGTLAALPDGDGSVLDRSLLLFGSNTSDSHAHDHFPLPLALVGGGGCLRGGQHLRYPDRTPMSDLLLTLLHRAGVPAASVGDSTRTLDEL